MGEATENPGDSPPSQEDDHDDHGHRQALGTVLGLNVAINAVLNAASGYGLAWLLWKEYDLAWLSHEGHGSFEAAFVVEDLAVQGALTAVIVTLIVASILHRQWDGHHLEPGRIEAFELGDDRSRGRHLVVWSVGGALASAVFGAVLAGLAVSGGEEVSGSTFALARTANGLLVGGAVGGLVTASWVTNLSEGRLVRTGQASTVVGRTAERAAGRPWVAIGLALLATGGLALGVPGLDTDLGPTDALARGNASTEAAENLTEHLEATRGRDLVFQFRVAQGACQQDAQRNLPTRPPAAVDCGNITDEVYVRAIEDFADHLRTYTHEPGDEWLDGNKSESVESPVEAAYGLPSFTKIANWSLAGGQGQAPDEAYSLPARDDRVRSQAAQRFVADWLAGARERTVGPDVEQATVRFSVDPETDLSRQEVGALALEARQAYVDEASQGGPWTVFGEDNPPLPTVQSSTANAHRAELAHEDAEAIGLAAGIGLLLALAAVLRNPATVGLVAGTTVAVPAATAGLAGHLGVGLSTLDMVLAPALAGIGAAFGLFVVRAFARAEREGLEGPQAAAWAGDRGAFPAYLASMVALFGLTALALGPSVQVARFAGLTLAGLLVGVLLAVTLVPAVLALLPSARPWLGPSAASEHLPAPPRAVALVALGALVLAGGVGGLALEEADRAGAGTEALAWPEDDRVRADHVAGLQGLASGDRLAQPGAVVVEGHLSDPDALAYLDALETELRDQANRTEGLQADHARTLSDAIRDWLDVCCGPQSPLQSGLTSRLNQDPDPDRANSYPRSEAEANATLEAIFETPYRRLAAPFVAHPTANTTVVDVRAETTPTAHRAVQQAIDEASDERPDDVQAHATGPAADEPATREDQLDWLVYAAIAAASGGLVFGLGYTLDPKVSLAFGLVVAVAALAPATAAWALDEPVSPSTVLPGTLAVILAGLAASRSLVVPRIGDAGPDPVGDLAAGGLLVAALLPATSWLGDPGLWDRGVEVSVEGAFVALAGLAPLVALAGWALARGGDPEAEAA